MGTWDSKPWDNDAAADWYGTLMEETALAQHVEQALKGQIGDGLDVDDDAQVIRVAAAVLLLLGHNYVWPVDDLERHLALAVARLEEIIAKGLDEHAKESIHAELTVLRSRLTGLRAQAADHSTGNGQAGKWWCI